MAQIPPAMPRIYAGAGSNRVGVQRDPFPEVGSAQWFAGSFVYTSGTGASTVLNPCITDTVLCYGWCPDEAISNGAASPADILTKPPQALFGLNHYPFDVRDVMFEVTITNGSASGADIGANGVTWAGGGTGGVALAPGQRYGMIRPTSGTYVRYQFLDVTDTTNDFFEIVALAPNQATTDNNPRVIVRVIADIIQ